ncbi:MAG: amidohydrolase family protein [Acidimicrobiales bacterium]
MAVTGLGPNQTHGLVCAHHHLYSALARGMPPPPRTPGSFLDILELVWWRLDMALDLDAIEWSAKLGALEALERGTTCIIDHHESPATIEGSLSTIADACAEIGVRVNTTYGVTDRHRSPGESPDAMSDAARRGLEENRRFIAEGGRGMVGVHAAFTCSDETLEAAAGMAKDLGVGVHIHVAEGHADRGASTRLADMTTGDWLLVHGVHLADDHGLQGTIVHNPRSNMNNSVGYARPTRFANPIALGTDGIGADMLDEFRVAFARLRESDVCESPDSAWAMLSRNADLFPESQDDVVTWSYDDMDPWKLGYTTGVNPVDIEIDGRPVMTDGVVTTVDPNEIRAKAGEAAARLHAKLET